MQNFKTIVFLILCLFLVSCNDDDKPKVSSCSSVLIKIGDGTELWKGFTVVKKGAATVEEANIIKTQLENRMKKASCEVKGLFAKKKIIIGLINNETHSAMSFFEERKDEGYDGIELVYTDKNGDGTATTDDNETKGSSALDIVCEKMMQIFDYYIATDKLREKINSAYLKIKNHSGVGYDNCAAYGNAAQVPPCPTGTDGAESDDAHPADMDLNPGAVLGKICTYQLDPDNWDPPSEFRGILDTNYDLADDEFNDMKAFLKKYFGVLSNVAVRPLSSGRGCKATPFGENKKYCL